MRNSGPCLCGDPECPRCFVQTTICGACEHEWPTNTGLHCPECGNGGDIEGHAIREENPRERGDDDGVEYADPGDELDRRLREDL